MAKHIGRAGQAFGKHAQAPALAQPKSADIIAEAVVPLGKRRGECAQLIAALPNVPRFGNQLATGEQRVLIGRLKKMCVSVKFGLAPQYAGQIEAETIDMKTLPPMAQAIHHPARHIALRHVEGVAGAGPVLVLAVRIKPIPSRRVDTALAQHQAGGHVLLGGVVKHHVQNHFDAGLMQRFHGGAQLIGGLLGRGGITRLHGEMGISVVAPIIHEAVLLQMIFIGMQRQGQQLDGGDAEAFQMADHPLVGQRAISAGIGQIGKLFGKPFHMRFVNHGVCPRRVWVLIVAPIEFRRPLHHAFGGHGGIVAGIVKSKMRQRFGIVITRPARHARGIRVEQ